MKPKPIAEKLKLCSGMIVGLVTALLLWKMWPTITAALVAASLGISCIILWAILRPKKITNKIVTCIMVSAMAVSPNVMADDYAGFDGKHCYCIETAADRTPTQPPLPEQHVVMFEFILDLDPISMAGDVSPRIVSIRHPDPTTLVSYEEMNAFLVTEWGINLDGGQQFSKNGLRAAPEDMPFVFGSEWNDEPFTLYPNQQQYRVVVEVAAELGEFAHWQPLAYFSIPASTLITVQDTPDGSQSFYRIRAERPPEDFQRGMFQPAGPILLGCGLGLLAGTAVIAVLAVRACAKNKKKFEKMQRAGTNSTPALRFEFHTP